MKDLTNREFKQITSSNSQKFEGKLAIGVRTSQLQSAPKLPLETATIRGKEQMTRSSANWEEQYLKTPRAPPRPPIHLPGLVILRFSSPTGEIQIKQRNGFFEAEVSR